MLKVSDTIALCRFRNSKTSYSFLTVEGVTDIIPVGKVVVVDTKSGYSVARITAKLNPGDKMYEQAKKAALKHIVDAVNDEWYVDFKEGVSNE